VISQMILHSVSQLSRVGLEMNGEVGDQLLISGSLPGSDCRQGTADSLPMT